MTETHPTDEELEELEELEDMAEIQYPTNEEMEAMYEEFIKRHPEDSQIDPF